MRSRRDIIIIGAGHAGCEAALAASRMGLKVLVLAINLDTVAAMPCSPSIGGTGKGQLVREIDALGGAMARIADRTAIQYRTLNTKKGPAVQSTRTQNDKARYHAAMKLLLESEENCLVRQATVDRLILDNNRVTGVTDHLGNEHYASAVILCTGTFLSGLVHVGHVAKKAGRAGEFASYALAGDLCGAGFAMNRMKTGTPARLLSSSIDFSAFQRQTGDPATRPFSRSTREIPLPGQPSWRGYTNARTHEIVGKNLHLSALYSGRVQGTPARYCPSLEDKVVRFQERERHAVILEPEGLDTSEIYVSGLGNSLPMEIQVPLVRSVLGLEEAEIMRCAYAIEYDALDPKQLLPTLETRKIRGLYTAGQINGTSGYEEAAAQGLWAGINAACAVLGRPPFLPDRSEAYMAVMVDDLTTRGVTEPYRMFTSRAEYRLLLREDNADFRLLQYGHDLGLVPRETLEEMKDREAQIKTEVSRLRKTIVKPNPEANRYLTEKSASPLSEGQPMSRLLKRTQLDYGAVKALCPPESPLDEDAARQVEIFLKYEGYIQKQMREVAKYREMESIRIPLDFDYSRIHGLSREAAQRLSDARPESLGRVTRMEGITPAAVHAVVVALKANRPRAGKENLEKD